MSTRCQIGFYKEGQENLSEFEYCLIYRHSDGYPSSVIPDILPFLKDFDKNRGLDDTSYAIARLTQHLCNIQPGYLGHGIDNIFYSDIEYFYAIYLNKVEVYKVYGSWDETEFEKWELIETHYIKED